MTKPIQDVISKFPASVTDKYNFVGAVYTSALERITGVVCPEHGEFSQYSARFRKGWGCPDCGVEVRASGRRADAEEYFAKVALLHKGKYTYPAVKLANMNARITVTCPDHGDFETTANRHYYRKQGCPQCGGLSRGVRTSGKNVGVLAAETSKRKHAAMFVERAIDAHGAIYDYSKVTYSTAKNIVEIVCPKHGSFHQRAEHHLLRKQGCPSCGQKSAGEQAVAEFLTTFTGVERRNRTVLKPKELDIYLPELKLAVEYCGEYFHGVASADEISLKKRNHITKHRYCAELGIRLITLFELEWKERNQQVRRLLRAAVGKLKGRVFARKCDVKSVPIKQAREFFEKYHIQGGSGTGEHYGLYWNEKLVACMRFTFGGNDRGTGAKNRSWTLSRYATRINVVGGASRLFSAFVQEHQPEEVKSFSDNRFYSGGMYEKLGFVLDAELPEDYQVWSPKLGLRPKSHYQRRQLQTRLDEHGVDDTFDAETDPRTESEMTYLMGCRRLYDCGKKRWLWRKPV